MLLNIAARSPRVPLFVSFLLFLFGARGTAALVGPCFEWPHTQEQCDGAATLGYAWVAGSAQIMDRSTPPNPNVGVYGQAGVYDQSCGFPYGSTPGICLFGSPQGLTWTITGGMSGYGYTEAAPEGYGTVTCTAPPGSPASCPGSFAMNLWALKGDYEGTVTRYPQGPVVGASVTASRIEPPGGSGGQVVTDDNGHFQFRPQGDTNNWGVSVFGPINTPLQAKYRLTVSGQSQELYTYSSQAVPVSFELSGDEPHDTRCEPGPGAPDTIGEPCSVTTGNVFFDQTDASLAGLRRQLTFSRSYNSTSFAPGRYGLFGPGWNHSFEQRFSDLGSGGLKFRRADGTVMYYYQDGAGAQTYHATFPPTDTTTVDHAPTGGYVRHFRDGGSEAYDPTGKLLSISDRVGLVTTLTYTNGQLTAVSDVNGRSLTLEYEGGLLKRVLGPMGLIASFEYETLPLTPPVSVLSSVTYADGPDTDADPDGGYTFVYEPESGPTQGYLLEVHDLEGRIVEKHSYDDQRRGVTSEKANGVEKLTLDYQPGRTIVTDARNVVTTYDWKVYWGKRRVTRIAGPCSGCGSGGGDVQEWTYDASGRVHFYKDGAGNVTEYVFDGITNDLLEVRRPLTHTTVYSYYTNGRPHTRLDPNGRLTTWSPWVDDGVQTVTENVAAGENDRVTTFTYAAGKLQSSADPRGKRTDFTYFPSGDLQTVTDPLGTTTSDPNDHITRFEYDGLGRRWAVVDPLGHRTETQYNTPGQVLRLRRFNGSGLPLDTRYTYDRSGRRRQMTDPQQHITDYIYDDYGRLWKVKPPSEMKPANSPTTLYEYDPMSNLWKLTDAEARATVFERDGHGRVTKVTYPGSELREERYTYDGAGRLATRTDRRNIVTTYAHDALGRLTSKTYSNGDDPRLFVYDENGDKGFMTSAQNDAAALFWDYDLAGQVRSERAAKAFGEPIDSTASYLYDEAGNRKSLSLDGQLLLTYDYDDASRLEYLWRGSEDFYFEYYDNNQRDALTFPNQTVTNWDYDALGQLTLLTTTTPNSTTLASSVYSYDDAGNRVTKTHPDYAETYGYDMEYRLMQVLRGGTASETYTYDKVGNRKTSISYPAWQYNARNELTSYGPYTLTYDQSGNLATKTGNGEAWAYEWNAEDELTSVRLNSNTVASFDYDPLGRRIQKITPNNTWTRWLYDGEDILRRTTSIGAGDTKLYIHGPGIDEPLAEEVNGTLHYVLSDGLGSVLRVIDGQGADVVPARRYNAFGVLEQGAATEGHSFTGREWDPETGLYYYRARYYDPKAGRFISNDPAVFRGGLNLYGYVSNRPTSFIDPNGLVPAPPTQGPKSFEECIQAADAAFRFCMRDIKADVQHCSTECTPWWKNPDCVRRCSDIQRKYEARQKDCQEIQNANYARCCRRYRGSCPQQDKKDAEEPPPVTFPTPAPTISACNQS